MDCTEQRFACFVYEDRPKWNGYACPLFTREVAQELLNAIAPEGWSYDSAKDQFLVNCDGGGPEEYAAINTEHGVLYGVGAYGWCWEEVDGPNTPERIAEVAEEAFWAKVAELCPSAKSGDLAPDIACGLSAAMQRAVAAWIDTNT